MSRATSLILRAREIVHRQVFEDAPAPEEEPIEVVAATVVREVPRANQIDAWLGMLVRDEGCRPGESSHQACHAADQLGTSDELSILAVSILEQAVSQVGRPSCVRLHAIKALAAAEHPAALRALSRMHVVAQRRVTFDPRPEDRIIAFALRDAIRSFPRELGLGLTSP